MAIPLAAAAYLVVYKVMAAPFDDLAQGYLRRAVTTMHKVYCVQTLVIKEQGSTSIQSGNFYHVGISKCEVSYRKIFLHPF